MNYNLYLLDEVSFELNKLRKYKNKLYDFFDELKNNPFLESHSQLTDRLGNTYDIYIVGKYLIYYYVDHPGKEIKVVALVCAD